jgi:hypothetical protein
LGPGEVKLSMHTTLRRIVAPLILNIGIRQRRADSLMPRTLYPRTPNTGTHLLGPGIILLFFVLSFIPGRMQLHEEQNLLNYCEISGFRREVDENCALLGYYAARSRNFLSTFRDNQSVPSSKVNNPRIILTELLLLLKLLCQILQSLITNICYLTHFLLIPVL